MRTTYSDLLASKYLRSLVKEAEADETGETTDAPDLANGLLSELLAQRTDLPDVLWDGDRLRPEVRRHLLNIAQKFHASLGVRAEPTDIRLTGSMANFNWTPKSDIDLHPVYNLGEIDDDPELVRELLQAKRAVWNDAHTPVVRGHEVEVYPQDEDEPHHATGVYSVLSDEWVKEPRRERAKVDRQSVAEKADGLMHEIDSAEDCEDCLARLERIKAKIAKMRQCGLEQNGEYSVENLAFKVLRNNGYLEKLSEAIKRERDAALSLKAEGEAVDASPEVEKKGTSEGAKRGWETRRGRAAVKPEKKGRKPAKGEDEPKDAPPAAAADQQLAKYRQAAAEWAQKRGGVDAIREATKTVVVGDDWQKYQDSLQQRDDLMLDFVRDHAGKGVSDETHSLYKSWALDIHNREAITWRSAAATALGRTADDEWFDDQLDRSLGLRKRMAMGADEMTQEAARASKAWSEEVWKAWHGDEPKTVYRGVELSADDLHALSMGESVDFGVNALSSWTTDPNTAQEFGNVVVTMEATPEDVWGYHRAHTLLDDDEAEVILGHTTPKVRLVEVAGEEGQLTVRAEPVTDVSKDQEGAERHLDAGDNGNWLHETVRGPRRTATPEEKARAIAAAAIEKAGTAEGAKRGWETRRGRAPVEETPADKKVPGAEEDLGDPKSGKIALDWLSAAASPGEEPDTQSAKKIALDWLQESAPEEADAEAAEDLVEDAAEIAVGEEKPPAEERTKIALDWLQSVGQEPTPDAQAKAEAMVAEVLDEIGVEGHDEAKEPEAEAPDAEPEASAGEPASEELVKLATENHEILGNTIKSAEKVMDAWSHFGFEGLDDVKEAFAEANNAHVEAKQALGGDLSAEAAAAAAQKSMEADLMLEGMMASYRANIDEMIPKVKAERAAIDEMSKVAEAAKLTPSYKNTISNKSSSIGHLIKRLEASKDPNNLHTSAYYSPSKQAASHYKQVFEGQSWSPTSSREQAYKYLQSGLEKKYGPKVQQQLAEAQKALNDPLLDKKAAAAKQATDAADAAVQGLFKGTTSADEAVAKVLSAKKAISAAKSRATTVKKKKGLVAPGQKKIPPVELKPVKVSDKQIAEQLNTYRGLAKEYAQKKFGGDPKAIKSATESQSPRATYMHEFVKQALKGYGAPGPGLAPLNPEKAAQRTSSVYGSWAGSANSFDSLNWRGAALQAYNRTAEDEFIGSAKATGDNKKTLESGSPYARAAMIAAKPWAEEVWKAWHGDKPKMVYRGVHPSNFSEIRNALDSSGEAQVGVNSLSSWSESKAKAGSFGGGKIVLHQRITPDRVWGYYRAHKLYGSDTEREVVVGHPQGKVKVRLIDKVGSTYHVEVIDTEPEAQKAMTPADELPVIWADEGDNADWLHEAVLGRETPMDDPHPEDPDLDDLDDEVTPWEEWDEDDVEDEE